MGNPIYEEKRRLKREIEMLQEQTADARMRRDREADALADITLKAVRAFLEGNASFVVESAEDGKRNKKMTIRFEMSDEL